MTTTKIDRRGIKRRFNVIEKNYSNKNDLSLLSPEKTSSDPNILSAATRMIKLENIPTLLSEEEKSENKESSNNTTDNDNNDINSQWIDTIIDKFTGEGPSVFSSAVSESSSSETSSVDNNNNDVNFCDSFFSKESAPSTALPSENNTSLFRAVAPVKASLILSSDMMNSSTSESGLSNSVAVSGQILYSLSSSPLNIRVNKISQKKQKKEDSSTNSLGHTEYFLHGKVLPGKKGKNVATLLPSKTIIVNNLKNGPKKKIFEKFRPYQAEKWKERFADLLSFRMEHDHCLVPHTYPSNPILARWVKRQRYQYKLFQMKEQSSMTAERIQLLANVGFVWHSHEVVWQERLNELLEFRQKTGHCLVPSNYSLNPKLATWVKCQRRQYKLHLRGSSSNITDDRVAILENIGFEWQLRSSSHTIQNQIAAHQKKLNTMKGKKSKSSKSNCHIPAVVVNNKKIATDVDSDQSSRCSSQESCLDIAPPSTITDDDEDNNNTTNEIFVSEELNFLTDFLKEKIPQEEEEKADMVDAFLEFF